MFGQYGRPRSGGLRGLVGVVIFIALAIVFEVGIGHLVPRSEAVQAAQVQGFTHVRVTSAHYAFVDVRGCGSDDTTKFNVTAVNPAGQSVSFYVCAGWPFKGATIRYK
jgi:hypothetical protein